MCSQHSKLWWKAWVICPRPQMTDIFFFYCTTVFPLPPWFPPFCTAPDSHTYAGLLVHLWRHPPFISGSSSRPKCSPFLFAFLSLPRSFRSSSHSPKLLLWDISAAPPAPSASLLPLGWGLSLYSTLSRPPVKSAFPALIFRLGPTLRLPHSCFCPSTGPPERVPQPQSASPFTLQFRCSGVQSHHTASPASQHILGEAAWCQGVSALCSQVSSFPSISVAPGTSPRPVPASQWETQSHCLVLLWGWMWSAWLERRMSCASCSSYAWVFCPSCLVL